MRNEANKIQISRVARQLVSLIAEKLKRSWPLLIVLLVLSSFQMSAFGQFAKPLVSGASAFHAITNPERTIVYVYTSLRREADALPKRYMVLTIRPSTLTNEQISDINGILGINILSGQETIEADASKHQLEMIQSVLAPSANDSTLGLAVVNHKGQKEIDKDPSAQQWAALRQPSDDPLYTYKGPIPAAKTLARMVVIIGLVAATIYVAFAAFSVTSGQAHGGNRVIAAATGLILLLMGYTIYKIMMINAVLKNGIVDTTAITKHLPLNGLVNENFRKVADTPKVSAVEDSSVPRSGLPVQPLSGR
jgi:hypothetical protein